jgi:hypothetical protein
VFLDAFSEQTYREKLDGLLENLPEADEMDFKLAVENSNPYSDAKQPVQPMEFRGSS